MSFIALNRLVKKLDKRLPKRDGDGQFKFKKRVLGPASILVPPPNCVSWAVKEVATEEQDAAGVTPNSSSCSNLDSSVCSTP